VVPNTPHVPIYRWFPDGHIAVLSDGPARWLMFWAEFETYRTTGSSSFPEDQTLLEPSTPVMGGRKLEGWDNGGAWLVSVFRLSAESLVGFVHAEDHWSPRNPEGMAWKSAAVSYSEDDGLTWSPAQQILTTWKSRPDQPEWGGAGDMGIVWDSANARYVMLYQEQDATGEARLHLAISTDPNGAPGTWFKWNGKDYTEPGLGGRGKPLPEFIGHEGANPSVHWNNYLNLWVMVYGGWDGAAYISASPNLLDWQAPQVLVRSTQQGRAWYPTILSDQGDLSAGQSARLYYADIAPDYVARQFLGRSITFERQ
jgi:hypothetical protein